MSIINIKYFRNLQTYHSDAPYVTSFLYIGAMVSWPIWSWRCTMSALSISWHPHKSRSISCNETHQVTFEIYHFFCVRKMKRPMMVWKLNLDYLYANISLPLLPSKRKRGGKRRFMIYAEMPSPYACVLVSCVSNAWSLTLPSSVFPVSVCS